MADPPSQVPPTRVPAGARTLEFTKLKYRQQLLCFFKEYLKNLPASALLLPVNTNANTKADTNENARKYKCKYKLAILPVNTHVNTKTNTNEKANTNASPNTNAN